MICVNNDPADPVANYVLQSITEPPHKYVRERHYPLPSFFFHGRDPAFAVAQTLESEDLSACDSLSELTRLIRETLDPHPDDVPF